MRSGSLVSFLLLIGIYLVYGQIHDHAFVDFDDALYVTKNRHLAKGFGIEGLWWALTNSHAYLWQPVTWLSYLLDFDLYGRDSAGPYLITNVVLSKMDGHALAERLRCDHPALKVLFVSGFSEDDALPEAVEGEADALIQKPFSAPELLGQIRSLLTSDSKQRRNAGFPGLLRCRHAGLRDARKGRSAGSGAAQAAPPGAPGKSSAAGRRRADPLRRRCA